MKLSAIFEAAEGSSAPLYHATNLDSIVNILTHNYLRGTTTHSQQILYPHIKDRTIERSKLQGVSLTRDKSFAEGFGDVILILDQAKLRTRFKIIPVNYFKDDTGEYSNFDREEREEFVLGTIKDLSNYVVGIYFPKRLEQKYTNWAWVQKNIQRAPAEFTGWKMVVESPKYIGKDITGVEQKKSVNESILKAGNGSAVWSNDGYEIKAHNSKFGLEDIDLRLYKDGEQIGYLLADLDKDNYVSIANVLVSKKYRNKGFAKLLYQTLLKQLSPSVKGIKSNLIKRIDKNSIPKIYQSMGGYEKDGYAYIDKNVNENSVHVSGQKHNGEEVIYTDGQRIATISPDRMSIKLFDMLRPQEKLQVGRITLQNSHGGYAMIIDMKVSKSQRGMGYGSMLVLLAINNMPKNLKGIKNKTLQNPKITSIYNKLDAVEEDGWMFLDLDNTTVQSDLKQINESQSLNDSQCYLVALTPRNFRLNKRLVKNTLWDLSHGRMSKSKSPIKVLGSEYGQWNVVDGYHRIMQAILLGKKKVKIVKAKQNWQVNADVHDTNLWNWDLNELMDRKDLYDLVTKLREGELYENGRIVQGVNTPIGITVDHTKDMAKKLGFNVSRDGRPPIMPTNGLINSTPQQDPDHSAGDKKLPQPDLTPLTNYKGKDVAE